MEQLLSSPNVRQYVVKLRKKMGAKHIKNVWSLGYMVEAEEKE